MTSSSERLTTTLVSNASLYYGQALMEDESHMTAVTAVLSVLVLAAAVGNALLFYVVVYSQHHRHESDFFIASMAVADFIMCTVVFPFTIVNMLHEKWRLGEVLCKFWIFFDTALCAVTIYTMSAICMNVSFHVRMSHTALHTFVKNHTKSYIAGIWATGMLISGIIVALAYDNIKLGYPHAGVTSGGLICVFHQPIGVASMEVSLVFIIPLAWCVAIYVKVVLRMRAYSQLIQVTLDGLSARPVSAHNKPPPPRGLFTVTDRRTGVIVLGMKLVVFFLAWTPYFVVKLITSVCLKCTSNTVHSAVVWLPYTNSWISPIIYGMLNKRVRNRLGELCSCLICNVEEIRKFGSRDFRLSLIDMTDRRLSRFGSMDLSRWRVPWASPSSLSRSQSSFSWNLSAQGMLEPVPPSTPHKARVSFAATRNSKLDSSTFGISESSVDGGSRFTVASSSTHPPSSQVLGVTSDASNNECLLESSGIQISAHNDTDATNSSASPSPEALRNMCVQDLPPAFQLLRLLGAEALKRPRSAPLPTIPQDAEDTCNYSRGTKGVHHTHGKDVPPDRAISDVHDGPALTQASRPVPARRSTLTKTKARDASVGHHSQLPASPRPQPAPRQTRKRRHSACPRSSSAAGSDEDCVSSLPSSSTARRAQRSRPKKRKVHHRKFYTCRANFNSVKTAKRQAKQKGSGQAMNSRDKSASALTSRPVSPAPLQNRGERLTTAPTASAVSQSGISENNTSVYLDAVESISSAYVDAAMQRILSSTSSSMGRSQNETELVTGSSSTSSSTTSSSTNSDSSGMYVQVGSQRGLQGYRNFLSDDENQRREQQQVLAGSGDTAMRVRSAAETEYFTTGPTPDNSQENILRTCTTDDGEKEEDDNTGTSRKTVNAVGPARHLQTSNELEEDHGSSCHVDNSDFGECNMYPDVTNIASPKSQETVSQGVSEHETMCSTVAAGAETHTDKVRGSLSQGSAARSSAETTRTRLQSITSQLSRLKDKFFKIKPNKDKESNMGFYSSPMGLLASFFSANSEFLVGATTEQPNRIKSVNHERNESDQNILNHETVESASTHSVEPQTVLDVSSDRMRSVLDTSCEDSTESHSITTISSGVLTNSHDSSAEDNHTTSSDVIESMQDSKSKEIKTALVASNDDTAGPNVPSTTEAEGSFDKLQAAKKREKCVWCSRETSQSESRFVSTKTFGKITGTAGLDTNSSKAKSRSSELGEIRHTHDSETGNDITNQWPDIGNPETSDTEAKLINISLQDDTTQVLDVTSRECEQTVSQENKNHFKTKKFIPTIPPRKTATKDNTRSSNLKELKELLVLDQNNTSARTQSDDILASKSLDNLCTDINIYHSPKPMKAERLKRILETDPAEYIEERCFNARAWIPTEGGDDTELCRAKNLNETFGSEVSELLETVDSRASELLEAIHSRACEFLETVDSGASELLETIESRGPIDPSLEPDSIISADHGGEKTAQHDSPIVTTQFVSMSSRAEHCKECTPQTSGSSGMTSPSKSVPQIRGLPVPFRPGWGRGNRGPCCSNSERAYLARSLRTRGIERRHLANDTNGSTAGPGSPSGQSFIATPSPFSVTSPFGFAHWANHVEKRPHSTAKRCKNWANIGGVRSNASDSTSSYSRESSEDGKADGSRRKHVRSGLRRFAKKTFGLRKFNRPRSRAIGIFAETRYME